MAYLEDAYQLLRKILEHCHITPYGGHYRASHTNAKVWQSRFYWPTMYEGAKVFCLVLLKMLEAREY
jgi:hypothetical protein